MAIGVDMFGTGGEGLGGLFAGQQVAQQQQLTDAQTQQALGSAAHAQALAEATGLDNQFNQAIMGDKINAYRQKAVDDEEERKVKKFNSQGEQFGRLGQTLASIPAAARPAALRQLASQSGVAADNPMLQHMMEMDPETMPDAMMKYSQGFYDQGDKARAEKQKRDAMLLQMREQEKERNARAADSNDTKMLIAQGNNDTRALIASMAAAAKRDAAHTAASAKKGSGGGVKGIENNIAQLIMEDDSLSPPEKLAALQRYGLGKATVGKSDAGSQMGLESSPEQKITNIIEGGKQTKAPASAGGDIAKAVERNGQKYEPDKYEYRITADGRVQRRPKQ